MKTCLHDGEKILFEEGGGPVGAVASGGGKMILTNKRLFHESGLTKKTAKVTLEIPVEDIVSYRHAYNTTMGMVLPLKNAFTIFNKNGEGIKFAMNKSKKLFILFKELIPNAQQLEDEKYGESIAGIGLKIGSNIQSAIKGSKGEYNNDSQQNDSETGELCPNCNSQNENNSQFCSSCGHKLQVECKNCKAILPKDSKFCNVCGQPTNITVE